MADFLDFFLIFAIAAFASGLTLVSGFGLGTLLLPVFALFLPAPEVVAATAVVHLLNNLFKGALLFRRAEWAIALRFGIPAIPAAMAGAWLLARLGDTPRLFEWSAGGQAFGPTGASLTIGALLILLAVLELQRWFRDLRAPGRLLPLGGLLTGFVGGLTGQQGVFRSIFLLRTGLPPETYIATGVLIAILIDVSRLTIYAASLGHAMFAPDGREALLIAVATVAAFAGAYFASRRIERITVAAIRRSVAGLMMTIGFAMIAGLLG